MKTDLDVIRKLEQAVEKTFSLSEINDIASTPNTYAVDADEKVIGLNITACDLLEITLLGKLSGLELLLLPQNSISDISSLRELSNLRLLDLSNNKVSDILPLTSLSSLAWLRLEKNPIYKLPDLGGLANLSRLLLRKISISDIAGLRNLVGLKQLDLSENEITDISHLKNLINIEELNLGYNQIADISVLTGFKQLTAMTLSFNQISDVSPLKELKNLALLDLVNNQISDISNLRELKGLKTLYLNGNRIADISALKDLFGLSDLRLYSNQIDDISSLRGLRNINLLDLRYNKIKLIPKEFVSWKKEMKLALDTPMKGIYLDGNPLEQPPPEIVKGGLDAVESYFRGLEGKKRTLDEMKMLLVGDGGAGKTSLVKRLIGLTFDKNEPQTHGINIRQFPFQAGHQEVKANIWDFGGQEIMHATHQFFLTKRSMYVLVLDGRKDEKTEYWLKHIKSLGGDSPVLVVINKIDQNPSFDVNRRFLIEKYPNIKGFYALSCVTLKGFEPFARALRQELGKIGLIRTVWSEAWFNVKSRIEEMNQSYISLQHYVNLCEDEGIKDDRSRETLAEYLNDLGTVIHYKDFDLKETYVLEPRWVTAAVYKIINSEEVIETGGLLELEILPKILAPSSSHETWYSPDHCNYIVALMQKFELCYIIDAATILIPQMLPVQQPEINFDYTGALKFRLDYDFLPRSVMPRFIVKMHMDILSIQTSSYINQNLRWRTGVVLRDSAFKCVAIVKSDEDADRIYISIQGVKRQAYLAVILLTLRNINSSFEKIKIQEMVPLPDQNDVTVSYRHLLRLESMKVEDYIPDGAEKSYKTEALLGALRLSAEHANEDELLDILKKLQEKTDTEETLLQKANDILLLQPNFQGLGLNLKDLVKKLS